MTYYFIFIFVPASSRFQPDRQLSVSDPGTSTSVRYRRVTSQWHHSCTFDALPQLHRSPATTRTAKFGPLNVEGPAKDYIICLPRAIWIVPIEVGGITPTSVTTAVIFLGGVRSYNGFNISRFVVFSVASDSGGIVIGNVENTPFNGPSSFFVKLSN